MKKQELPFLHAIILLELIHNFTNYCPNTFIPKCMVVTERTSRTHKKKKKKKKNELSGDIYKMKKVLAVILAFLPIEPDRHPHQILSKYLKGYTSNGAHKNVSTADRRTDARQIAVSLEPIRSGIKSSSPEPRKW